MVFRQIFAATALACAFIASASIADQLDVRSVGAVPSETAAGVTPPVRGLTKSEVENRFGAPAEKVGPVGEPPISRWVYNDYTVYFEHQYVLHSVPHRR